MEILADNRINMVKLESRPIPWQYKFYTDLETDIAGPEAGTVVASTKIKQFS